MHKWNTKIVKNNVKSQRNKNNYYFCSRISKMNFGKREN